MMKIEVRASQLAQASERGWFSNTSFTTGLKTLPTFRPDALVETSAKFSTLGENWENWKGKIEREKQTDKVLHQRGMLLSTASRYRTSVEEEPGPSHGIRTVCLTRWTVHDDAIESILDNYYTLKRLWDECLETKLEPDVKGSIIGVQTQVLRYNTLFGLQLSKKIQKITENLSCTLQHRGMSAAEGQAVAELTVHTLKACVLKSLLLCLVILQNIFVWQPPLILQCYLTREGLLNSTRWLKGSLPQCNCGRLPIIDTNTIKHWTLLSQASLRA